MGCFGALLKVVDNYPTFFGSRFSTGRLLAREDFTLYLLAIGHGVLMHECFPKHSRMGTARMKEGKQKIKYGTKQSWHERK